MPHETADFLTLNPLDVIEFENENVALATVDARMRRKIFVKLRRQFHFQAFTATFHALSMKQHDANSVASCNACVAETTIPS